MPEILPSHVPSPRTLLAWDGTAYRPIHIDAAGNVQIDVLASALPAGAATAANQVIINATVELVALIRNALQSVDTDRLIVRGQDQLFSIKNTHTTRYFATISGANGSISCHPISPGTYFIITTACAWDKTTGPTEIRLDLIKSAVTSTFASETKAWGISERFCWSGQIAAAYNDSIRAYFPGGHSGDQCELHLTGFDITVET